ncbi:DUF1272 domain-containing protein [Acidisarcina polymorpha]|uniref:DUF1272 domain-containing protein n=1 Tax=Acidisarcina polymorpha TaxID=2211140 RepID=UPI0039C875D4
MGRAMLGMKCNCERCGGELPQDSLDAMICSFECTFFRKCTVEVLKSRCPNCGGELIRRPVRALS